MLDVNPEFIFNYEDKLPIVVYCGYINTPYRAIVYLNFTCTIVHLADERQFFKYLHEVILGFHNFLLVLVLGLRYEPDLQSLINEEEASYLPFPRGRYNSHKETRLYKPLLDFGEVYLPASFVVAVNGVCH